MSRVLLVAALLLASVTPGFAGERVRYSFPLFETMTRVWSNKALPIAQQAWREGRDAAGIPADGTVTLPENASTIYALAIDFADATYYKCEGLSTSRTQWRNNFINRACAALMSAYPVGEPGSDNMKIRNELERLQNEAQAQNKRNCEISEALVNIPDAFEQNVIAMLMDNNKVHPDFGARALFAGPNSWMYSGDYIEKAVPNWNNYLKYSAVVDEETLYRALGEAILNSAVERTLWSPIEGNARMSWFTQYVYGYTQGIVSKDEYVAFIAAMKARAKAAQALYVVRKQQKYKELVDEWLIGVPAKPATDTTPAEPAGPPLFAEYEDPNF